MKELPVMRKYYLLICLLFLNQFITGQILEPVKWKMSSEKEKENEYILIFEASIDDHWHLYSQFIGDDGPIPTYFGFDSTNTFKLVGETEEEGEEEESYDPIFKMQLKWFNNHAVFKQRIKLNEPTAIVTGWLEFMTCDDKQCLPPETIEFTADLANNILQLGDENEPVITGETENGFGKPYKTCVENTEDPAKGILGIFFLGFLGGLIAFLTPCVFPMVPLTVSFFTKKSGSKRKGMFDAVLFGFCIIMIYVLLSIPFFILDASPDTLNELSTNVYLNLAFFAIFIIFAISFFGYFELTLPSSWSNKADTASNIGGIVGIFFMALTLALVSFSCTGPILGTLLVGTLSAEGGNMNLVAGMAGFGFALALPFTLFAAFPQWLETLPKSGGWMNTIKVVMGFLEVGLALKFLSNADLVEHWGLLKREIFIGLWILTSLGLALYLFGFIKFPLDDATVKISWGRIITGAIATVFVIYMIPGMWGANLKLLSGFPPPMFYSLIESENHCPHNLNCFHDFEDGMAYAKEQNKPVMVDFTGWACVNCRKMEENIWVESEVYNRLAEDYILISLYVDDKESLPEEEQYISAFSRKKVKTIGNKWSDFQASNFNSNSQPFYVLLSPDKQLLSEPAGYTPDVDKYVQFLDCGINAFKEIQGIARQAE